MILPQDANLSWMEFSERTRDQLIRMPIASEPQHFSSARSLGVGAAMAARLRICLGRTWPGITAKHQPNKTERSLIAMHADYASSSASRHLYEKGVTLNHRLSIG
jgi:hypothetical protein